MIQMYIFTGYCKHDSLDSKKIKIMFYDKCIMCMMNNIFLRFIFMRRNCCGIYLFVTH